jgi:hypothetical protein
MIRLQIHNDGKEKHSSFEAKLKYDFDYIYCNGSETKEDAIEELKQKVLERIKEYQNIDWESFDWVTWDGKII